MKKLPIIMIPVIVVILLLAGVLVWKLFMPVKTAENPPSGVLPNALSKAGDTKPTNPFGFLFGSQTTPIPTPTPASAAAMNAELNALGDDGGAADIKSLQSDAAGL